MEILRIINENASVKGLPFLIAGGHAVNLYGISRQTGDIDLIVCHDQREEWKALIAELHYEVFHEHQNFIQYSPPELGHWPIDLMLVKSETFAGLAAAGREVDLDGLRCRIPSAKHLIAMKLHALKENFHERELKDISDIIELLQPADLFSDTEEFRRLCERYGNLEIYEQVRKRISN